MKIFAIIPAAGKGRRSGYSIPKQYVKIRGKELIGYTVGTFQKNNNIDEIIIAAHPEYFPLLNRIKKKFRLSKVNMIVEGGNERQDSVYNALKQIKCKKNDLIIVHDAARPLLSPDVLNNSLRLAKLRGNAVVCVKAGDTLITGNDEVEKYIDRNNVYYVQTPQIFKYIDLRRAMERAYERNFYGTDESMLVKMIGRKIFISPGSPLNFKITTKPDLLLVSMIIDKL